MKRVAGVFLLAGLVLPLFLLLAQEEPAGEAAAPVVATCQSCHSGEKTGDQWGVWAESGHARSFRTLATEAAKMPAKRAGVTGDPQKAELCLSCHAPVESDPEAAVSCQVCHGESGEYAGVCGESFARAVDKGMRLSGEKDCVRCHRPSAAHPDSDFRFVLDVKDIAHPRPDRGREAALFTTEGLYTRWETFDESDGLPHHIVFGVTPWREDVWFATEDGAARLRDGKFTAWHTDDGLPHQAVTQIAVDPETGEVWASTLCGIAVFDGESKWTAFTQENSGLCNNCTFGIGLFGDDVWVATFDGVARYNRKTKEWKRYYLDNAPLEEVWIYGLETDHEKVNLAVWGGGLVEYFPNDDHFEAHHDPDGSFEMDLIQGDGVISQMTTSASRDNGWTWMASYFGMSAFNGRTWIEMDMDNSGLVSNFINFVKARRSEGWFATDRGISSYDLKRKRWVNYRRLTGPGNYGEITIMSRDGSEKRSMLTETSIPYNFVWGIAFSGEDIWVATSDGVARGRY